MSQEPKSRNETAKGGESVIERELKLAVPDEWSNDKCAAAVASVSTVLGTSMVKRRRISRTFHYFDTADRSLLRAGATLRCVTGFSPEQGDGRARCRYDYKDGAVGTDERSEAVLWSDLKYSPADVARQFPVLAQLDIRKVLTCLTSHQKWTLTSESVEIEASLDEFRTIARRLLFRELEFEIIRGELLLHDLRQSLAGLFPGTSEIRQQKYRRVTQTVAVLNVTGAGE